MRGIDYVLADIATEIEEHVKHWDTFDREGHIELMRSFQSVVLEHISSDLIREQAETNIFNINDDDMEVV